MSSILQQFAKDRKKKETTVITARIPNSIHEKFKNHLDELGLSINEAINFLINIELDVQTEQQEEDPDQPEQQEEDPDQQTNIEVLSSFKHWTTEEDKFLKEHYGSMTAKEIAKILGKKPWSVFNRAHRLSIQKEHHWKQEEDLFLMQSFEKIPVKQIGEILKRSEHAVWGRIRSLREKERIKEIELKRERSQTRLNKGKEIIEELIKNNS